MPKFILGNFNHCTLNKTLKTYHQYVTCPTRFNETIDSCFGTVPGAYTSLALPPLGSADHSSVLLAPVYKPVIQRVQRVVKTVKDWTEDCIDCLQGCFDCTDWEMFDQMCTSFNELMSFPLGSEEQEQPAKNCLYRLQDNCSVPERSGSFL